tara:strand:- start:250 stop:942 length:693 start_codon:yes stop_codon:yes gene_type:complete
MTFSNLRNEYPDFPKFIHQAALDPHLDEDSLNRLCDISKHFNFSGFCTNLIRLPQARLRLGQLSQTKLIAVISFPFGSIPTTLKIEQAKWAISQGAEELDIVPNFFALSQNNINFFAEELAELCELDVPVRAILDIARIPIDVLSSAIEASIEAGVYGLQSGNGFGPAISKKEIQKINEIVRGRCAIKAVGGIKSLNNAIELIETGSTQIGTSYGEELMQTLREHHKNEF